MARQKERAAGTQRDRCGDSSAKQRSPRKKSPKGQPRKAERDKSRDERKAKKERPKRTDSAERERVCKERAEPNKEPEDTGSDLPHKLALISWIILLIGLFGFLVYLWMREFVYIFGNR